MTAGLSDMAVSFVFRKLSYKGYTSSSEYEPLAQRDTPVPMRDPHVRKSRHCARICDLPSKMWEDCLLALSVISGNLPRSFGKLR